MTVVVGAVLAAVGAVAAVRAALAGGSRPLRGYRRR